MTALGAVFRPQSPPEKLRSVVRTAEEVGLEELWLWEDCFLESGIASASAALAWSERLRVGVGLLPVPLRNAALTTMEAATLHRLFPGRVKLGVGHGVQDWMGQVGARAESPMTLLREHLVAMRALLRGERVTVDGRYVKLDGVALDWPPATVPAPPAVLSGARGPRSLRLSGEAADGTVLDASTTVEGVRAARALIDEGRALAGRTEPHGVTVYVLAVTGPDAERRLAAELEREGLPPTAALGVAGDAEAVAAEVRRYVAAGADTVVLQSTADDEDPDAFIRFTAEEVRPLI
ncbi:LLM class flavin-dependent oxidoreductase [Streptomyces sp. NPDC048172]|uniref:LLM class flavin-dependent oxidoreductase n=1 Tax=Streptomyces sp. NPDC048172 TaxID=3365505 RepID=UPI003717FEB9